MKQFYRYDPEGFYLPGQDYLSECAGERSTELPPLSKEGIGLYKAQYIDGVWVEAGQKPEPVRQEPTDIEKLEAKLKASSDYVDFLEEVIVEMAQVVYQ